ncbi:carboxymuconolactone decarboxylase family protein [Cytophagaceae bacterium YF14B1]|uniref:Carboxymuconolactone decarboxylase family protein n=1 Tax=Xanthocytophaga flava TaxID=3048013 RepID=A0AAE3U9K0_9BACT|nr:carboxymuconolactone decarboxylase family protein [Xanthocytophaga flavus]MDJ1485189.1 carboxymuconolactone decarboxylase family protein [Xanthocytophaga flavus]
MAGKSLFTIVSYNEAIPEVQKIYDETKKELGIPFVLNWFKCQGNNAILLRGNWEKLRSTLIMGNVPNLVKQLIIYNVSSKRKCEYCATAHAIFANMMGKAIGGNDFIITENQDSDIIPVSYKTALRVVTKGALHPETIGQEDFDELYEAGFDSGEIQELMAQADLVNMLNTIADISGIKVDNELLEIEV